MCSHDKELTHKSIDGSLVLLLENNDFLRTAMRTLIGLWGYDVLDAPSARQMLTALKNARRIPDILISDYRPHASESGIDAIRAVRALSGRRLPAILLINELMTHDDNLMAEEINVLRKPIDPHQLRTLLTTMTTL